MLSQWSKVDYRLDAKLVRSCNPPVLLVEFGHSEVPKEINSSNNYPHFRRLDNSHTNGADLWYGTSAESKVPCWLMAQGTGTLDNLRSLRLCILRIHAEIMVLNEVLKWLKVKLINDTKSINIKELNSYFKYIDNGILNRENRANFVQSEIVRAALDLLVSHNVMLSDIRERFEIAREKIEETNSS